MAAAARAAGTPRALPRRLLWVLAAMTFAGWVGDACAGWYVTEIGRQPFIVYGLIRTADVASKVAAPMIALTLALYVTLYLALIVAYVAVLKYMAEKPEEVLAAEASERAATPPGSRPRRRRPTRTGPGMTTDDLRPGPAGDLHGADGRLDADLRRSATATTSASAC